MVREITKDIFFLGQKSEPATEADIQTGRDLQDTLKACGMCWHGSKHDRDKKECYYCEYGNC